MPERKLPTQPETLSDSRARVPSPDSPPDPDVDAIIDKEHTDGPDDAQPTDQNDDTPPPSDNKPDRGGIKNFSFDGDDGSEHGIAETVKNLVGFDLN